MLQQSIEYTHICPKCGNKVYYKSKRWYDKAVTTKRLCKDCNWVYQSQMYDDYIIDCLDSGRKLSKSAKQWIECKREEKRTDLNMGLLRKKYIEFNQI